MSQRLSLVDMTAIEADLNQMQLLVGSHILVLYARKKDEMTMDSFALVSKP